MTGTGTSQIDVEANELQGSGSEREVQKVEQESEQRGQARLGRLLRLIFLLLPRPSFLLVCERRLAFLFVAGLWLLCCILLMRSSRYLPVFFYSPCH